jgi:hypothetical protein
MRPVYFNTDTGGESVKTVENGIMKLVINKLSWHFYQLMIDPFDSSTTRM